jgi:single-strand DNA-binding protein
MSQDNQITLRGFVTAEPKFRQTVQTATPVTEIRVGSTPRRLNRETGEWQEAPTSYYTVKCWRRLAINAVSSLHKGDMVVVRGRFYMNSWVDSQQRPRATLEIEADSVGHDLAYGWSHYMRGSRPQAGRSDGVNAGELARQDTGASGPDDGDDAYPADSDPGELPEAGLVAGEADPGVVGDPLAAALATVITEGEEVGGLEANDALAASGLTGDASLPEAEAVPF